MRRRITRFSQAEKVLRRHSLDRMIVFGEAHLRRILGARMRNCPTVATAPGALTPAPACQQSRQWSARAARGCDEAWSGA